MSLRNNTKGRPLASKLHRFLSLHLTFFFTSLWSKTFAWMNYLRRFYDIPCVIKRGQHWHSREGDLDSSLTSSSECYKRGLSFGLNRGCHWAIPSAISSRCMIITLLSFCLSVLSPLLISWLNLYYKLWIFSAGRHQRIWPEKTEFITWENMSLDNRYFFPPLWRNSGVMRWPLFFVREMRGHAHHCSWVLHSACFDNSAQKAETVAHAGEDEFCGTAHN